MEEREVYSFSRGLPSPEELFHSDEWEEYGKKMEITWDKPGVLVHKEEKQEAGEPLRQDREEKPAPKRKKIRFFFAGAVMVLLVLIIINLSFFHIRVFCMMSESMGDAIPKGSIIISYEAPAEKLETGDVITYMNRDGVLITHEIAGVFENYKGSGCYAFRIKEAGSEPEDEELVTYGMVKGKALFYIPYIGKPFVK